jgi:uncharacterized protein YbjT (DUF2867 family)
MRILLLGASGFIGRYLLAHLAARGHEVVPAVRDPEALGIREPGPEPVLIDLNLDTTVEAWLPRLEGIDAVVNCAGILQGTRRQSIEAIHHTGPAALFAACERAGVRRVVQVSAVSATLAAGTDYALTKLAGDDDLRMRKLSWVVLRPSLVVAPGAYGGTALFRALAAFPFFIPVPGPGTMAFQPLWIEDLALLVARALETNALEGKSLDPVGPDEVGLAQLLIDLRAWLGFGRAPAWQLPLGLVRVAAKLADFFGGPGNSTALRQMQHGNTSSFENFRVESGIEARGWREALARHPAQWQDRLHARLYFVRPLLRLALAALWIGSAIAGTLAVEAWAGPVAKLLGLSETGASALLESACAFDFLLGVLVLIRWRPTALAFVQLATVVAYTVLATLVIPGVWGDPFGAILKNVPILAAVVALAAMERDR